MKPETKVVETLNIYSADRQAIRAAQTKVIREVSLKIYLQGKWLATIACTGNHLDELALGFMRSEQIIDEINQIEGIEIDEKNSIVKVTLKDHGAAPTVAAQTIASGGARVSARAETLTPLQTPLVPIKTATVLNLMKELLSGSIIHNETHGTHCSALARADRILVLREDIGRHNTIDMLCGYGLLHQVHPADSIILTTGRISSEIVYKIWNWGIPIVISHSAPTSSAVDMLNKANITLIGYVRGGKMNIYSHERRVTP